LHLPPPTLPSNPKSDSLAETKNGVARCPLDESALGEPEQVHRVSARVLWLCWLAAVACLLAAALVVQRLSKPFATNGPLLEVMLLGGAFLTGGLVLSVMALRLHTFAYLVFPDGLVHVRGGRRTVSRWDEITGIFETRMYGGSCSRIVLSDGRARRIASMLKNHKELEATILARVTKGVTAKASSFEMDNFVPAPRERAPAPDDKQRRQVAWSQIFGRTSSGRRNDHDVA
jgi:hypothetical protein